MNLKLFGRRFGPCIAAMLIGVSSAAWAQEFPMKPIRLVVPYPAAGTTDLMARLLQEPMRNILGQPVLVVNKDGAAGTIGAREVALAAPDGYSILFANCDQLTLVPLVVKGAGYTAKDFVPIGRVSSAPLFVMMNAAVPANDVASFVEYSRKQPNAVEYGSAGVGQTSHLATELFARTAGIKMLHVPYKGTAPATQAVLTGEVKLVITSGSAAMRSHVSSGKLKLLGITSAQPSVLAPGAPTVASVLPEYVLEISFALFAPAGTPPAVVAKLNDAVTRALALPEVQQGFLKVGVVASSSTTEEVRAIMARDMPRWAGVVRDVGIRAE